MCQPLNKQFSLPHWQKKMCQPLKKKFSLPHWQIKKCVSLSTSSSLCLIDFFSSPLNLYEQCSLSRWQINKMCQPLKNKFSLPHWQIKKMCQPFNKQFSLPHWLLSLSPNLNEQCSLSRCQMKKMCQVGFGMSGWVQYVSKKMGIYKLTPLNHISHKGEALILEMEILSDCLLAPHPHTNFIFVLKHWLW